MNAQQMATIDKLIMEMEGEAVFAGRISVADRKNHLCGWAFELREIRRAITQQPPQQEGE